MSHTVTVKLEMTDKEAIQDAVDRTDGAHFIKPGRHRSRGQFEQTDSLEEAQGRHTIYSGTFEGIGVQLPGWNYPVIVNPETGEVKYDNFGGHWGNQDNLDEFAQAYAVEKARTEALLHGLTVTEDELDNGDIKLTVNDYRE
jgi:hypothetical protein